VSKRYDKYKDSGIEWYGEIPIHWNITRLKFLGEAIGGVTYSPSDITESKKDSKLVLRSSNIQNSKLDLKDCVFIKSEVAQKKIVKKGDILICSRNGSRRLIGKNITIDEKTEGETFGAFMMIFRSNNWRWVSKYFNSPIFTSQSGMFLTATINQLTKNTLDNFFIAYPPLPEEQTQIANYLDHKTQQIDELIDDKQRLIELLKEERTATINQAVTKGIGALSGAETPNVPMKDSGIEWLGEIPEHWESWKIGHAFTKIGSGTTPESGNPKYHLNGTINWLNTGDLNNGELFKCKKKITQDALNDYSSLKLFSKGSLVIAMYGATIGKTSVIQFDTTTNQACCVFGKSEFILIEFLHYWFKGHKEDIINLAVGGGQPNISQDILKNIRLYCPTIKEQKIIVKYIKQKQNEINDNISKTEQQIELLKEYKTALISEVVTGKVDVRDEVIE